MKIETINKKMGQLHCEVDRLKEVLKENNLDDKWDILYSDPDLFSVICLHYIETCSNKTLYTDKQFKEFIEMETNGKDYFEKYKYDFN